MSVVAWVRRTPARNASFNNAPDEELFSPTERRKKARPEAAPTNADAIAPLMPNPTTSETIPNIAPNASDVRTLYRAIVDWVTLPALAYKDR